MRYTKQDLNISEGWVIKWCEFYDIDPLDDSPTEDKASFIFWQEDMLWISKGNYHIDLGWYGGQDLRKKQSGYSLYLYRGDHWNKCELLEKFRSKRKDDIVNQLNRFIRAVDSDSYKNLRGYVIDEDDPMNRNSMEDHEVYSVMK